MEISPVSALSVGGELGEYFFEGTLKNSRCQDKVELPPLRLGLENRLIEFNESF